MRRRPDADAPAPVTPEGPDRRAAILKVLRASATPRTILDIAEELGVHPNTVRFHLGALVSDGRVEQLTADPRGVGRPPLLFQPTRAMSPDGPTSYRLLATMLASHLTETSLDPAATATELGRQWGPRLVDAPARDRRLNKTESLRAMADALSKVGFEPEGSRGTRETEIRLRHCPFLDLVDEQPAVICSLHLGLMQGAFASMRAPVTVDVLEPFVEPDLCVAHLRAQHSSGTDRDRRS